MFEQRHTVSCNIAYTPSKDSDQHAHPHSLVGFFAVHFRGCQGPKCLQVDSKDTDQPARMMRGPVCGLLCSGSDIHLALSSRKHAYIIFDPLTLHFLKLKLGFTGVYIVFLISAQTHRLWVIVEAVLTNAHYLYFEQKYEKYQKFLSENF